MKKYNCLSITFLILFFASFFSNNITAQEKKIFLQSRFNGFSETLTKDFTREKLNDLKNNLERQGLFFSYSNLKFNKQNEIIKITINVKNKKSNTEVTFNDNDNPIPNIKVGESNGIASATLSSTPEFVFSDTDIKTVTFNSDEKKEPIYIVNGKIITNTDFKKINTNTIESISVLKGNSAIKKYGEKGKNGVIEIKTKSK